jgi:hypothetical protein
VAAGLGRGCCSLDSASTAVSGHTHLTSTPRAR